MGRELRSNSHFEDWGRKREERIRVAFGFIIYNAVQNAILDVFCVVVYFMVSTVFDKHDRYAGKVATTPCGFCWEQDLPTSCLAEVSVGF